MIVNVYIDGFNLYYGCLKGTPYKWLDVEALARRLLPNDQINRIRYLATYLLLDAFRSGYETAMVVTNDSDLSEPIRVVREELKLPVGVVNPHPAYKRTTALRGTFFKQIRPSVLASCQLPPVLRDARGSITRPEPW